jgi:lipoic acid synthetase
MGETAEELRDVLSDLRSTGCDVVTIGQYLQPTRAHLPVVRFYAPEEFVRLKSEALAMGFAHVEASPLTRSSYHAGRHAASSDGH